MNLRHRISAIIEAASSIMTAYTGNPIRNSIINGTDIIKEVIINLYESEGCKKNDEPDGN